MFPIHDSLITFFKLRELIILRSNKAILIAYLCYIALGSFDGLLGVVWPEMSSKLGVPLEALGVLAIVALVGFVLVSFNTGPLIRIRGLHTFLLISIVLRTIGFASFALFPSWSTVIIAIFISALGAGGIDAGLNIFIARRGTARQINWLHACFGIGATLGPFLAAGVQAIGGSWEWNFGLIAVFMAGLSVLIWFTSSLWQVDPSTDSKQTAESNQHAKLMQSLRLPVIWISTTLFFFYVGTELSAGQWSFTLFSLGRGIPELAAKFWVGIYWGIFTVGRILFGLIADKVRITRVVRAALITSSAGAVLLAWNPAGLGIAGLVLMGFAQAPIYPSLIATTVARVGAEHAQNAIGFQGAAGGVGGTTMTSLIGLLAVSFGFEMIAVSVVILSLFTYLMFEILLVITRKPEVGAVG